MITLGLEEEVFITEPLLPTTRSLYYLSRLLWQNPRRNYKLTASNFARGKDLKYGLMSGAEVATGICTSPEQLISELKELREKLALVAEGLIVPIGHLIQVDTPTNVAALQIHVGCDDKERVYDNIAHFLPVLIILSANSPFRNSQRVGQSYRLQVGYATGPLLHDRYERFQDLIISKRLGTIELRAFDPIPCLSRIRILVQAVYDIASLKSHYPLNLERYKHLRQVAITTGLNDELNGLLCELQKITNIPTEMVTYTQSDATATTFQEKGLLSTYKFMDKLYRGYDFDLPKRSSFVAKFLQPAAGFLGYYLPKFPYISYKYFKEK